MKALQILTDSSMQPVEITGSSISEQNESIWELLGGFFETVRLAPDAIMLVDEDGLMKRLASNHAASMLAETHIVGKALIVGLRMEPDREVFCDCPRRFLEGKIIC